VNVGGVVFAALTATPAVAAIAANRVLPVEKDQDTELPAVVYIVQLGESSEGTAPLQRVILTVHALAHTETDAHNLAVAMDGALDGLAARDGATTLRPLSRAGWQPDYMQELNMWIVSLTYEGWVTY
jgi:hypothetical protein